MTRLPLPHLLAAMLLLLPPAQTPAADPVADLVQKGVQAYSDYDFSRAATLLEQAKRGAPERLDVRFLLGCSYANQYLGTDPSGHDDHLREKAVAELKWVLEKDPNHSGALEWLGYLSYARGGMSGELGEYEEARSYFHRRAHVEPTDWASQYWVGVLGFGLAYRANRDLRRRQGLPPTPGESLLPQAARVQFIQEAGAFVDDGIEHLEKARELDPLNADALPYLNLLYRLRADTAPQQAEHRKWVELADATFDEFKKLNQKGAGRSQSIQRPLSPPPPPPLPPPPPGFGNEPEPSPRRIRVSSGTQEAKVVHKVNPEYPPLAKRARIQGTVVLEALIGKDGSVVELKIKEGHPMLVQAAVRAASQWRYQPTLHNGEPVEVETIINVQFRLY